MVCLIRNPDKTIKTWRERADDVVLAPGESVDILPESFAEYSSRLKLSVNGKAGQTITIHDRDLPIRVDVSCREENHVDLSVNGNLRRVNIENGEGMLELSLLPDTGRFLLEPADRLKYCAGGEAVLFLVVHQP